MGAYILFGFTPSLKHSDHTIKDSHQTLQRSSGINNPAKAAKCSKGQFMISLPLSLMLCLQAEHSICGGEWREEEEINISTVISSLCLTCGSGWGETESEGFTWPLLYWVSGKAGGGSPTS